MLREPIDEQQQFTQENITQQHNCQSITETESNKSTLILKLIVVSILTYLLYHISERVLTLSRQQTNMRQLLINYQQTISSLQNRIQQRIILNEAPLTQKTYQQYQQSFDSIKHIENIIEEKIQGENIYIYSQNLLEIVTHLQDLIIERDAVINTLVGHSKQNIRKKKIELFEKIGKKVDFQQEKIRNPWALSKLNLRTPYIDSLQKRHLEEEIVKEAERLEEKYKLHMFKQELPLCIIVPTRNNAENYRYQYNLQSILNQVYSNYKIVIIDDASEDATPDLINIFLKKSKLPSNRYFVIRNKKRMTAVPNIYNAIKYYCNKQDIAILVSGDDELLGKRTFQVINAIYQTKKPGIAYTNHFFGKLHQNDFDKGYSRPYSFGDIRNRNYRFIGQHFGHMRTFLVSLFLEIKEEHMKDRAGNWVQATYDETFILPILEMSCDSIEYIDEYMYLYNYGTGNNDGQAHHETQLDVAHYIRELPKYQCIPQFLKYSF